MSRWIEDRYGRTRGLVGHGAALLNLALGRYGSYADIDWSDVSRLVFVCEGNVCRSPYAEARALDLGILAASFGIEAAEGRPASLLAAKAAAARGLDLSMHRALPARAFSPRLGDLLVAMEPGHARRLRKMDSFAACQITLIGIWGPQLRPFLQDPHGLSPGYFQTCFEVIDRSVAAIADASRAARPEQGR